MPGSYLGHRAKPHRPLLARGKVLMPLCSAWRAMPASSPSSVGLVQSHEQARTLEGLRHHREAIRPRGGDQACRQEPGEVGSVGVPLRLWHRLLHDRTSFARRARQIMRMPSERETTAALGKRKRPPPISKREAARRYRAKHPGEGTERSRRWRAANRERHNKQEAARACAGPHHQQAR
jgi:hypothetical protein